ncbi:aromatic-ring-hydroxylating dioxygenase subunit beta, partial [Actinomadura adrarensis]
WSGTVPPGDPADRGAAETFLYAEARLLDQGRFEEWLDLYGPECLYWIPGEVGGGDPSREVAIALDDRRRLEDRVVWLRSAFIWSQIPRSRTVRSVTNVETLRDGSDLLVRSNFLLHDVRGGRHATHFGWYLHRIDTSGDRWRVRVKQVHLADCDQAHENVSLIF